MRKLREKAGAIVRRPPSHPDNRFVCWQMGRDTRLRVLAHQAAGIPAEDISTCPFAWNPGRKLWEAGFNGTPFGAVYRPALHTPRDTELFSSLWLD